MLEGLLNRYRDYNLTGRNLHPHPLPTPSAKLGSGVSLFRFSGLRLPHQRPSGQLLRHQARHA